MSLVKRNGIWHWRKMINGEDYARSTKLSDKKLAEQLAAKWEAEALKAAVIDGTKIVPLHHIIEGFLNSRKSGGGYSNACVHIAWWRKLPNVSPKKLTLSQIQDIVRQRTDDGASHNTVVVTIRYWNALMNFALKQGWVTGPKLQPMKQKRTKMRILTKDEEERLLKAIEPKDKYPGKTSRMDWYKQSNADFILVLLHTGARYSEIGGMEWSQVDLERRTVHIRRKKNGNDTLLAMSDKLYEVLKRRKEQVKGPYVFPFKVTTGACTVWLDAALKEANISSESGKITVHQLRHTYASRMLQAGLSIVEVQQLLGHRNLESTAVYLHVQKSTVASKAAELLNAM